MSSNAVNDKIREMDYYFDEANKINKELKQLISNNQGNCNIKKIRREYVSDYFRISKLKAEIIRILNGINFKTFLQA